MMNNKDSSNHKIIQVISTRIVLINKDKILLVSPTNGDNWHLPGGWLDGIESYEECAIRELYEETGIKINNVEFFATARYISKYREKYKNIVSKTEIYCRSFLDLDLENLNNKMNEWVDYDDGLINAKKFFSKKELIEMINHEKFFHGIKKTLKAEEVLNILFTKKSDFLIS